MGHYEVNDLRALVRDDRIHRNVFVDPDIFVLEMERVFGRLWIFVGHESQVAKPGDFFSTRIGTQSVVMVRHTDGAIHVLYNRCGHRGARVVNEESGNARTFRCMYHGWVYDTDGRLAAVPLPDEYPPDCNLKDPKLGMIPVARVAAYRGFVFASLAEDGPNLLEYLGEARSGMDDIVDGSPEGEVEFAGGCHRYDYAGNWKHQVENLTDSYHTMATHASTVGPNGRQFHRRPGEAHGKAAFTDETGAPVILNLGVFTFPNGHSGTDSMLPEEPTGGAVDEYRALLVKRHGETRTHEILKQRYHNITIFPTMDILFVQNCIRVIIPISVDRTEVRIFPIRFKGAPPEIFENHIKYVNLTHSASSFVQSDDLEAFRRVQEGLSTQGTEWNLLARGKGKERYNATGVGYGGRSSEIGQRHQHHAWLDVMCRE